MKFSNLCTGLPVALAILLGSVCGVAAQTPSKNGTALAAALSAAETGDWDNAAAIARRNQDPIAVEIIEWNRLRAGIGSFKEYEAFLSANSDWPGLPLMMKTSEAVIPLDGDPMRIRRYFANQQPQTGRGALALALALKATHNPNDSAAEAVRAWRNFNLSQAEQSALWATFQTALQPYNFDRLDRLLWNRRVTEAQRMLPLVSADQRKLAEVRIALIRNKNGVDTMINALPNSLKSDAGLAYDRFRWRISKDYWDSAHDMLMERSNSRDSLGRPEFWSDKRRTYARRAMRTGDNRSAYYLASQHFLTPDQNGYSDLEWLSGFLALQKLNDPARAVQHFRNFRASVVSPISVGRAGYWLGRSYEAMGDTANAKASYALAATYQTSFYGQLAAERAGLRPDQSIAGAELPVDWTKQAFLRSDSVRAGFLFHFAGEDLLTRRFLTHASESLTLQERAALGQLALDLDHPNAALKIAKTAAANGDVIPRAYYPITDLADFDSPVRAELAMAIARQESEFNPAAQSHVGALGLMQVMPATAKAVAKDLGITYSTKSLGGDWEYNARIGTAYLAEMLERFDGSALLAAAAYNAGPHRADRWIRDYGDPRSANVDAIDWIETIPFRETRNYVMRVNEALFVYRARLSGVAPAFVLEGELNGR
ncbi:MAG: transglycosylase SLT domain-containing protein [Alphaproteobacteria bacterium]